MDKNEINDILVIVENALTKIRLSESNKDKRKRNKAKRIAEEEARDMVYPYKELLTDICHMENLNGELFAWGFLESDLQEVYWKLKEIRDSI